MLRLKVEPDGIEETFTQPFPLVRALWEAGLSMETPCGGFGGCGKCRVRFLKDPPEPTTEEYRHLTLAELSDGWRLACRHFLDREAHLFVPDQSRPGMVTVLTAAVERETERDPAVGAFQVTLSPPSAADERGYLTRLLEGLERVSGLFFSPEAVPLSVLRSLPRVLTRSKFCLRVIVHRDTSEGRKTGRILWVGSPSEQDRLLGLALDVGTTTLVGYLLDLTTGQEIACSARLNPQVRYGDDVISRLCYALQEPRGLRDLQKAVVSAINEIIGEVCQTARVSESDIFEVVTVGNTAMLHLFLGVNPEPIAFAPYVPVFQHSVTLKAAAIGLRIHPEGLVTTLPCVAGYVGADTTAVVLTHLDDPDGDSAAALDIGTNGEVVVRSNGRYLCSSAAAGPAFEGGRIYQGLRAERGAISSVGLEQSNGSRWFRVTTVGGGMPVGLCGSGLIDAVATLLDAGVTDESGYLGRSDLPSDLADRLISLNGQRAFLLVAPEVSARPEGIVLTQRDIRELQLAKGSIRAVTEVLVRRAGLNWDQVSSLYLAGAFGMFVNPRSAIRIGLLPALPLNKIIAVGNAAGAGAKLALISLAERRKASRLASLMEHIPMTGNEAYQEGLMEFIGFPLG